jgi:hypothetical protein
MYNTQREQCDLHLNGKEHLDTEVLALLHELATKNDLVGADPVADSVGGVGGFGNLRWSA